MGQHEIAASYVVKILSISPVTCIEFSPRYLALRFLFAELLALLSRKLRLESTHSVAAQPFPRFRRFFRARFHSQHAVAQILFQESERPEKAFCRAMRRCLPQENTNGRRRHRPRENRRTRKRFGFRRKKARTLCRTTTKPTRLTSFSTTARSGSNVRNAKRRRTA